MYRGRFAPSPTGPLHFGSLIAALASYCDARSRGGEWHVRIDDIDEPRSSSDAADDILRTLARYGFVHDGAIVYQRDRSSSYEAAFAKLENASLVYPCTCSRKSLEGAVLGATGERIYPGTCRAAPAPPDARAAWRFHVGDESIRFNDELQGSQSQHLARDVGDFVVRRSDGLFAYQLAVVVDDAEAGVTDVVRGTDLLASTPRQIALQRALGAPTPRYLHLPVATDERGAKLSKQTNAARLPDDPLPALARAWRFLDQAPWAAAPKDVAGFWNWAIAHWQRRRLPPVAMLPAL